MDNMLRIAVQSKGRLYDETMLLLEEAGGADTATLPLLFLLNKDIISPFLWLITKSRLPL